ncbi:MAG: sigma factor-like helix-turn-helix DNA-binding protein [Thermoguttaceae bacterium]
MPGRRYPRAGQRLAPRLLAEVLQDALPVEYAAQGGNEFARLCDLDERAWQRFGPEGCRVLAGEIVRAVGRAARQPGPFTSLRLPPMPDGMPLSGLELESRTFNCLAAAGIEARPQDLGRMTVEGTLSLRGFWSKCLVDLLVAIEHAADHPETRLKPGPRQLTMARDRETFGRYPRRGYRLAPAALREILNVPVPGREVSGPAVRGLHLCDLDEKVSQTLSESDLSVLGRAIVARVNISNHNRAVRDRKVPTPPKGMRLQDLALENRTYNCLLREGLSCRFEDLGKYTIGDLLGLKAFGAKCLLDLLSSLETTMARSESLDSGLTDEAIALGRMPEAFLVHSSDPRLGPLLRGVDQEADTLGDLVARVVRRRVDPPDPAAMAGQLADIRRRIREMGQGGLGEELSEIFFPASQTRDREIIAEYYGWDGGGGRTLEELGKLYGLSRERIRQVCMPAAKRHRCAKVFAPALDRAVEFVRSRLPIAAKNLEREFNAAGLKRLFLPPATVLQAAEFLCRDGDFRTVSVGDVELVVDARTAHLPKCISQVARRVALASGIATIDDVIDQVEARQSTRVEPSLVRAVVEAMASFQWLDEGQSWFHLESGSQYGVPNMIDKVFSVCGRIEVSRLRAALSRQRRSGRKVPPSRVLLAFCEQRPGVRVEGRTLVAERAPSPDHMLSGVEAAMVRVLREHGPVLERGAFEEHCLAEGMNRFSFNATLMTSPVIAQYGRSVYGLVGANVSRRKVRCLAARRSSRATPRVLRGFGTLADGRVYLLYQLSKAAIAGGVTTVPAGLKQRLGGDYAVLTADGDAAGKLVTRGGCAWGLGPALRSQRARPGDHMVLLLDPHEESAHVYLGERDLLDTLVESLSLQVAETWKSEDLAVVSER